MQPKLQLLSQIYESSVESGKALDFEALLKACFFSNLKEALSLLDRRQQVYFAYLCADSVKHLIKGKEASQASQKCLDLISQWLKNPESVTINQLHYAAYAANAAYTAYTAYAAAHAAYAAAYAANAAAHAAYAAAYAANAAAYVAYAAADAVSASNNKPKQSQLHLSFLIKAINFKGF